MPRSGKLPVLNLLTGQKSGFSTRRGDALHRFRSNLAEPTSTVRLAVQNFTSIGAGEGMRPQNIKNFSLFGKEIGLKKQTRNKSIVPCWTMHTGRMSCHSTKKGVNYYIMLIITMCSRLFPANCTPRTHGALNSERDKQTKTKKNKHHIFAPTAGARCTIFPKLCVVIELVVPIKKGVIRFRSNV